MACASVSDIFREPTESLSNELYLRASWLNIWVNLIKRGTFPMGEGLTRSTFTVGRSFPTSDSETWSKVTTIKNSATPGACLTEWNNATVGHNERTYVPEQFGLRGPVLCVDEMYYDHNIEAFVNAYLRALEKRVTWSISNRLYNLYAFFVPKHVTVSGSNMQQVAGGTGAVPTGAPTLTASRADCELSQDHLDRIAALLNQEGAQMPDSDGWITMGEDGPLYNLYIGQEMSHILSLNNSEFRNDVRYAKPNMLLQRLGASRVIKNFRHVIDLFPPRYNYNGTAYVRVNTFEMVPGTEGDVGQVTTEYEAADFEAATVLSPWVFETEFVRPLSQVGNLSWDPRSYMGDWQWITGGKEITDNTEQAGADCFDPLHKLGRHFAEIKWAPKPVYPTFGRVIIYRRCAAREYSCSTCFESVT